MKIAIGAILLFFSALVMIIFTIGIGYPHYLILFLGMPPAILGYKMAVKKSNIILDEQFIEIDH
jgi:hypothetical protein